MKTKRILLCATALLIAACEKKPESPVEIKADSGAMKNGFLLRTEFPPELIEGTPVPMRFGGVTPSQVPLSEARGPGTSGVFYQDIQIETPRPPTSQRQAGPPPVAAHQSQAAPSRLPAALSHINPQPVDSERYGVLVDNQWQDPSDVPLSTFSVDVDTASYANARRMIMESRPVPADAVRLEEWVNYFDYAYPQPTGDHPFAVHVQNATCPWNADRQLVRVALKGKEIERTERPSANLVFLLDVSGSMQDSRKLPLVAQSLRMLVEELGESDSLAMVVYAGAEGLYVPATACDGPGRDFITRALVNLGAGGSTNGGAGIKLAYQVAREHFKPGGINRVILATDGDFNVGVTNHTELVGLVAENAKSNVDLTVLGVGGGNLNDHMLEEITNHGNGTYHYIATLEEARRVFLQKMMGTLVTIAKDVKIQIEFNPDQVRGYRLLGYSNRMLRKEDFANDKVDAGDIGSGHTVTAFYEIETATSPGRTDAEALRYGKPVAVKAPDPAASHEWLTVKLRYKTPGEATSIRMENPYLGASRDLSEADADFRFATAVAATSLILRDTDGLSDMRFGNVATLAREALGTDPFRHRAEFVQLVEMLAARSPQAHNRW
jgi:Ca-activated chloride channel family protein